MASERPITPVTGFNYNDKLPKNGWTRAYVRRAFPAGQNHDDTLKWLFSRATELTKAHNLYFAAFKDQTNARLALSRKRDEIATMLQSEMRSRIEFAGHREFAHNLCKGVLIYQGGPGKTAQVSEELIQVALRDYVTDLIKLSEGPRTSSSSQRASAPSMTPQPDSVSHPQGSRSVSIIPEPSLQTFEFNCFPLRAGPQTPPLKLTAIRIFGQENTELGIHHFRMQPLLAKLQARNAISDLRNQCLQYDTDEGTFGLAEDEDLQIAVQYSIRHGQNYLRIST